ncbi:testis-specific Y-encoded-like protein 5 [Perognathus longimembris pacificus]|uniref:testis-specific Y-encoded-like protein 5 n=1 Tax=Perognathus longimembris pacificus TaxID=214514 RepID=UPI0020190ABC|nr:testis-specific Y-encoded-like protein 5 [Perognathus longimembris pacificus]
MSGRSRSRKASHAKSRGKGRPKGRVCAGGEEAPREADPPQHQTPPEDVPTTAQVQTGARWDGGESAGPAANPQLAEVASSPLPAHCGYALQAQAVGVHRLATPRPRPRRALAIAQRLVTDTVFVGTVGTVARRKNAPRGGSRRGPSIKKAAEPCGAAGRGSQAAGGARPRRGQAAREGGTVATRGATVSAGEERNVLAPGPSSGPPAGSMNALERVQQKLETLSTQADRAYLRLSRKFGRLRLQFLERRKLVIQNIPGFWRQALQNHPQLSSFLNNRDKEVISYLSSLEVEELGLARLGYKIKFYFGCNPYFQNKVLIKEYGCSSSGKVVSHSTAIQWLAGHDLQPLSPGNPENNRSLFGWFSSHSSIESDKIVEIINEELWPNPLQYYLMSEGAQEEKAKEGRPGPAKQPVEDPKPGANQSK